MGIKFICENIPLEKAKRITQMEEEIFTLFYHLDPMPIPIAYITTAYSLHYNKPLPLQFIYFLQSICTTLRKLLYIYYSRSHYSTDLQTFL